MWKTFKLKKMILRTNTGHIYSLPKINLEEKPSKNVKLKNAYLQSTPTLKN